MVTRDAITDELLKGVAPAQLARKYPRKSVYRIYNELLQSGQLPEPGSIVVDSDDEQRPGKYPFIPITTTTSEPEGGKPTTQEKGAEFIELGDKTLPVDMVNRIRGILGITLRPKVLSCPTPELLYPAMVISVTELGFPPLKPDDFIDTVLYQWLEACDIIPYAFLKRSELETLVKQYQAGQPDTDKTIDTTVTADVPIEQPEGKPVENDEVVIMDEPSDDGKGKIVVEPSEIHELPEPEVVQEMKPKGQTVGDLLKRLHINNIQKEVKNGGTGYTKPNST